MSPIPNRWRGWGVSRRRGWWPPRPPLSAMITLGQPLASDHRRVAAATRAQCPGKVDPEGSPPAGGVVDGDVALHFLRKASHDGQAQTGATLRASHRWFELCELAEDFDPLGGWDTGTVVDHVDRDAILGHRNGNLDRAPSRVLHRVLDQVDDNSADMVRIRLDEGIRFNLNLDDFGGS